MGDSKSVNLIALTKLLRSDKVKERQEGISTLRTFFARDSLISSLDKDGKGQAWLVIFQALFDAFKKEKETCTKKGTLSTASTGPGATALRRLGEVASAVRWLTERSVHRLNTKVVRPLLAHLISNMKYQGCLLGPVALDYVKAIESIMNWTPHLEHLDEDVWIRLVELGFNVILGDQLKRRLDEEDEEDDREGSVASETFRFAGDSEVLTEVDDDIASPANVASSSKKRRRSEPSQTSRPVRRSSSYALRDFQPVSLEQVEFASLLATLLRSSSTPLLSSAHPHLPAALLSRLRRFLSRYSSDSSLHHNYLIALSATLSHVALNHRQAVSQFAREAWSDLVSMWGTKNQRLKEDLVVVLRFLFPYLTVEDEGGSHSHRSGYGAGISKLWRLLYGEAESRWGVDGLMLDSLRLQSMLQDEHHERREAFVASTFRHGWHFDANQALAWAILELQADCAEKLYIMSESVHSTGSNSDQKRMKLEDPVTSLLSSIQTQTASGVRVYHLQALLFFVDRHWTLLHHGLRQDIMTTLLQFLAVDDPLVQSWTFMCFAAIAYADQQPSSSMSPSQPQTTDNSIWDAIWTHSMRRSNVPAVCRTACHAAHVMLSQNKMRLTSQRVLSEIETLAKDLDVQGPSFPYDSVCHFLVLCMRVASQDVRLYRMQLEEKVLTWLMAAWRPSGVARSRMPLHSVADLLGLLEAICTISRRTNVLSHMMLPDCSIVNAVTEELDTAVIRDFLLQARLPEFRPPSVAHPTSTSSGIPSSPTFDWRLGVPDTRDLVQPRGRECKVSALLLKSLDEIIRDWEGPKDTFGHLTAEKARLSLDLSLIALFFEGSLVLNGTRSNRRVVQAACKLLVLVVPLLVDQRWTPEERGLIVSALEPLVLVEISSGRIPTWETMLPPGEGTGIRRNVLNSLRLQKHTQALQESTVRRELQRVVLQSADVQDVVNGVLDTLRDLVRIFAGEPPSDGTHQGMDVDDKDGFVTRQGPKDAGPSGHEKQVALSASSRHILHLCMTSLAVLPILQSSSGEPTRDKQLTDLVLNCEAGGFLLIAPAWLDNVRQRTLNVNVSNYNGLLDKLEDLLRDYYYSRNEGLQLLTVDLLRSTMHLWIQESIADSDVGSRVRILCEWLSNLSNTNKIRSWKSRDALVRFFDNFLLLDPSQEAWPQKEPENVPVRMLPKMGSDEDIRVRFRAAVANARMLCLCSVPAYQLMAVYDNIRQYLCKDLSLYEHMLTRLVCLANIMVVSSAVRRGPYWHLLETCLHSNVYTRHVETILGGVAARMGLSSFSVLFEAYASQIAYSIRQSNSDLLRFPPHILGYRDLRECAEATFRLFGPTNILAGGPDPEAVAHGRNLFTNHCRTIQKTTAEGFRECFADIVGFQIVFWFGMHPNSLDLHTEGLDELLKLKSKEMSGSEHFYDTLQENADGVITAILRTLGDQDCSPTGPIAKAFRDAGDADQAEVFSSISQFRPLHKFTVHQPNLPNQDAAIILRALDWFQEKTQELDHLAISYHVLHQLFAELERSPIVNEQMRLLNEVCLWVARNYDHFQNTVLLRTLVNGAVNILAQPDLARAAQSMLGWAFALYSRADKDSRLAEALIRTSRLAHDYSMDGDIIIAEMGRDILEWTEMQALELCGNKFLKTQVIKALSAWPRELSTALKSICKQDTSQDISAILTDHRISSNQFRLVRRLRDLANDSLYDDTQFSQQDFWRLKDCIPPVDHLSQDDLDAFAELLVLQKGLTSGLGSDQSGRQSVRSRHLRGGGRKKEKELKPGTEDLTPAQRAVVVSLLAILDDASASQVNVAYNTLRSLVAVSSFDPISSRSWSSEHREELGFLKAFCRPPMQRPRPDLQEMLSAESDQELIGDFSQWIRHVTTILSDTLAASDPFYIPLAAVLRFDQDFSEQALPVLVHTILEEERSRGSQNIGDTLSAYFSSVLASDLACIACRRSIVDTVLHLRQFRPANTKEALAHDKWLNIDYVLLSRSAILSGAYTTALLFLELAAEQSQSISDTLITEQILYEIYSHIDEPDGFYGIQTQDLRQFLVKRLRHEKQWDKAFRFHGAALEARATNSEDAEGVVQALHSFGFNRLAIGTLQGVSAESLDASAMTYHLGWRTETWDLPEHSGASNTGAPLYLALRAVYREREADMVDTSIHHAFIQEMAQLRQLGNENLTGIHKTLQSLMCLYQVRQWRDGRMQEVFGSPDTDDWSHFTDISPEFDFPDLEAIMATRISLLRSALQKEEREQIGSMRSSLSQRLIAAETKCLLRLAEAARLADCTQVALNSVVRAQKINESFDVSQEFASVLWQMKEPKLAVRVLRSILPGHDQQESAKSSLQKAALLARLGTWTSEACLEKPAYVKSEFFDPAALLVEGCDPEHRSGKDPAYADVYHKYAVFAERQYQAIVKSPDALRWKIYVDRKTLEVRRRIEVLSKTPRTSKEFEDHVREKNRAEKVLKEDQRQYQEHVETRDSFLAQAVDMYSRCLQASDAYDDDSAIKLCSLWFANFDYAADGLQDRIGCAIGRVPSRKFVFLAHQLSARLSNASSSSPAANQEHLQSLIVRMCREHPFHSLYQVFCLKADRNVSQQSQGSRRQSGRLESQSSQADRAAAAATIYDQLRGVEGGDRVRHVEEVCIASLEWAKHPIKGKLEKKQKVFSIPDALLIRKLQNVQVPVITAHTPLDVTTRYENCVWIGRYEAVFEVAGGVNLPKITNCIGSDGIKYKQLFKGEGADDLRQDAVMEQVFDLVNVVLNHDRETRRRQLSIRGYKVVPLAAQAGVLEFVGNTTPLHGWLCTAHVKYRPNDISHNDLVLQMTNKRTECKHESGPLTALFTKLRERFKPVMRHYFTERHKTPMSWFRMRLNYARSVATTSIVGHVLGLGDRHMSNILIDNGTGEVVHIDLGIAFDQGKLLPIPERVPFRLTPDMVDGLGTSGTQGVFQRCAEETLRVLREGSEVIFTVLEVFKYDPLHSWTASELKVKRVQGSSNETVQFTSDAFRYAIGIDMASGTADEAADRALSSVTRKLDKTLSVEYTVNELIAEATDVVNLANMYIGWGPQY